MTDWPVDAKTHALRVLYRSGTGMEIPLVGLGTFLSPEQSDRENDLCDRVREACDAGIPLVLDVANNYATRQRVSEVLQTVPSTGNIIVCSKGGCTRQQVNEAMRLFGRPFSNASESKKKKRQRTGERMLDMYLWHHAAVESAHSLDVLIAGWTELVGEGDRIRKLGLSNIYLPLLADFVNHCLQHALRLPDVVQLEMHVWCPEYETVDFLEKNGIHPMAYSPLGFGARSMLVTHMKRLDAIPPNMTPEQTMLGWNVHRGVTVIPQTLQTEHLTENLAVGDLVRMHSNAFDTVATRIRDAFRENINLLDSSIVAKANTSRSI